MKCNYCNKESIALIYGKHYCKEHFNTYFTGRVRSVIDKFQIKGRIAVALSGGKDSGACFHALHILELNLLPFHINLQISPYSTKCQEKSEELCNTLGYKLKIIDLSEYNISLANRKKPCSTCGTVKRYLMNKFAFEHGCDYVATGHNLSDVVTFALSNLVNVNILNFRGNKPYMEGKEKYRMVAKIKPLYYLNDKECMLYTSINELPYTDEKCPYAADAPTLQIKKWLHEMESRKSGIMLNMAKSFWKIEEMIESDVSLKTCKKCGYPSYGNVCKFCKIRKKD